MKIIRTQYLPPRNYDAINILGILFVHPNTDLTKELINHERIHTRQMLEMLILPFYIWYITEWLIRLPFHGRAYLNLSFEREAYRNMNNLNYLSERKAFAWLHYM
ncbi:MAG: hypothetical protein HXN36_08780 [Prevotella histicola]|jgi:hypothetical protein|uniref:hypothetical protein n=1 Tax=Prevotella histicola TaxID=470565 RepID=UPI001CAC2F0B|nr:hypothetical protein [Prevotella histicola]MBF1395031.1 hypothetical protein [Prevotella histicola]MBF1403590.1 hypothetical protein [Prevotella histicola]MBF1408933.1 hypothetical protein [Prevotella histicola]MBF1424887.1 hypothetical protein [Prevotella histicola]